MTQTGNQMTERSVREKRPTALKGVLFLLGLAILVALLVLVALTQRSSEGPFIPEALPEALRVSVIEAELGEQLTLEESFSGLIVARRTSQLGFSGSGRVTRIHVDVGDRVRTGQPLGQLDTRNLAAQLAAADASIAEARANYELSQTVVERQTKLFARGHVAQQRVDEATAQADAALARIEAASAQAEALKVAIDLSVIRAPFSGMITNRMIDEGAIAVPGGPVLELVEDGRLEARIGLPAASAAGLAIGQRVGLISDRGVVEAQVRSTTGIVDQTQRTIMVIFDILSPEEVNTGAIVRLSLDRTVDERGVWLPVSALTEAARGLWSVYVATPEDGGWIARPQLVEIVQTEGQRVYARGTVRDGDKIIIDGIGRLVPGQPVEPIGHTPALAAGHENEG